MASSSKSKAAKGAAIDELTSKLNKLELENKALRKRIKKETQATSGTDERLISAAQKEALVSTAAAKLATKAAQKIESRLRENVATAVTKTEVESAILQFKIRIDISMAELSERADTPKRSRSQSRNRAPKSKQ